MTDATVPEMASEGDPAMRAAGATARALITAAGSQDPRLEDSQVAQAVNELDRDGLIDLVSALARHGAVLAALPGEVLVRLGHDNVPADLVDDFGDRESTLRTAWQRVADSQVGE